MKKKRNIKGWLIGGVVGLIFILIAYYLLYNSGFKVSVFMYLIYFLLLVLSGSLISFLIGLNFFKKAKLLWSIVLGIIISFVSVVLLLIAVFLYVTSICTGPSCGDIGIAILPIGIILSLLITIQNIIISIII